MTPTDPDRPVLRYYSNVSPEEHAEVMALFEQASAAETQEEILAVRNLSREHSDRAWRRHVNDQPDESN